MWIDYITGASIGGRIPGIKKRESITQAKFDGGRGVVQHPKTGQKIYWQGP